MDNKPFYTWSNKKEFNDIINDYGTLQEEDHIIRHSTHGMGRFSRDFSDIDTNVSVRSPFGRGDYEYFRGNEALPNTQKELMAWCMTAYRENGLVKNIVDLMGDFVCQGIRLVHPNKANQAFFDWWWSKVGGKERSERMANMFYRTGTVVVRRRTGKLRNFRRRFAVSEVDEPEVKLDDLPQTERNEIPVGYYIHNPCILEVVGEELASFVGQITYAVQLPKELSRKVKDLINRTKTTTKPVSKYELDLLKRLPNKIREALERGDDMIVLDPEKTEALYYKKDDWQLWGQPMILAIIKDIILLEKMKLADMTALDGIISSVRLWRLGSLEHKIMPAPGSIRKLTNILLKNTAGGSYDLVWGPEIDFKESNSNAYQALGKDKYEPTLNAIYAGLGVPPTLTGGATQSGFTNNFISLKTLTERLNYCRDAIVTFWNKEIAIVQKALGLRLPAQVVFDHMSLSDETAEKALLIQLWDRNIISNEAINERFKEDSEIERIRIKQENKMRDSGKMAPKAGQWFNPEKEHDYKKILTQLGELSPEELGIELQEVTDKEDTVPNRRREKVQIDLEKLRQANRPPPGGNRGVPQQGRPKNSKDVKKRKTKQVKPRQRLRGPRADLAPLISWAKESFERIEKIVNPGILKVFGKKKMVSLTNDELVTSDNIKFGILMSLEPYQEFSDREIGVKIKSGATALDSDLKYFLNEVVAGMRESLNRSLTADDYRLAKCLAYGIINCGEDENGED